MPHAFIGYAGSTVRAAELFVEAFPDEPLVVLGTCAALTFSLRAGSLAFGWRLPVYRARPPRN